MNRPIVTLRPSRPTDRRPAPRPARLTPADVETHVDGIRPTTEQEPHT